MILVVFKNRKGLTLIEVIVTLALVAIVTSMIFSLQIFSNQSFRNSSRMNQMQSDVYVALDTITDKVRFAQELSLLTVATTKSQIGTNQPYNYIYIENGVVYNYVYRTTPSIGYDQHIIPGTISNTGTSFTKGSKGYDLLISLSAKNGKQSYTADTQLKLLNFKLKIPETVIQVESSLTDPLLGIRYK